MAKKNTPKTRIAVNGLGRIGRIFLRVAHNNPHFEIAALHSRSDLLMYAHLIKYDSTYGVWDKEVKVAGNNLVVDGIKYPYIQEDSGGKLPWGKMKIDVVVDATGKYTKREQAAKHLEDGAGYMLATAPMEDEDETLVHGVNHKNFNPQKHKIVSAASCTTVCSTLTTKVLEENFGIEKGFINTVHAFTGDQSLLDGSHKDLRRARTATESIIPTTSGVSKTIVKVYPHLKGKLSAISLRVPAINPSVVDYTVTLKKKVTKEQVAAAFTKAARGTLKNHLAVSDLPLVSIDFRGNSNGAIIDLPTIDVIDGNLLNVLAWYDNEWGYVSQMTKVLEHMADKISDKR